jgi:hypothetical protein
VKGIVFNLLETVVVREHGDEVWELLLEQAGLDGVYTSIGSYDDRELVALVGVASEHLGVGSEEVIRWFGRSALPLLADHYPQLFTPHRNTRSFLLTLNSIIHPEVRKLYPGAVTPEFEFDASSPEVLVMGYESPRKLCAFAEGLIHGAADHYGERAFIDQPACMRRGDQRCQLQIRFTTR